MAMFFDKVVVDTPHVFIFREEPLDAVEDLFGPSYFITLRNFDLNKATLKPSHVAALQGLVVKYLERKVGYAEIYAMTDRSGTAAVNYDVSAGRLEMVQRHLYRLNAPWPKVHHAYAKAVGEDFYEHLHRLDPDPVYGDARKNGDLRNVTIGLTPAPMGVPTRRFRNRTIAEVLAFGRQYEPKPANRRL
jgi:hypothetical protein